MTDLMVDPKLGRRWASWMEERCGHWWLIVWALHAQHFAAFYRGHWQQPGGVCRTASTPQELWAHMRQIQHEGRRQAMAAQARIPPPLAEHLADPWWRAAG
ncbi:hypothetical protein [Nonomuraea sp. NPDC050783]|uniref:hypothetical protein n=1 Tax=Nonomuraea sp. NPDC050783 TaxID=3154634 RepID=UPI00346604F5